MNKVLRYTTVILLTAALAALLYQLRGGIALLIISLAVTAISRPFLEFLGKWRISGFIAQLFLLILFVGILAGIIFLIGPWFMNEMQDLSTSLFLRYYEAYPTWQNGDPWQQELLNVLPEPNMMGAYMLGTDGELSVPTAINFTQGIASFFGKIFLVFIFSLYWAQSQNNFIRMLVSLFPAHQRGIIRETWKKAESAVSTYIRQELTLGLAAAVLLGFGYSLLGLPYPVTLAIIAFFSWIFPLISFVLLLIPLVLTAYPIGWGMVVLSVVFTLLVFLLLKFWVKPKYLNNIRYSSFLIVFWIVVLGSFLGVTGFLAGPVVAVALHAVWGQYLKYRFVPMDTRDIVLQVAALRERYTTVYNQYSNLEEALSSPQLNSLFDRLDKTLRQAEMLRQEQSDPQVNS